MDRKASIKIVIAPVRSADKKGLADVNLLLRQLSSSARKLDMRSYRRLLANKNLFFLAAKDGRRIVGMASLVLMETPTALRSQMEDVVVSEEYRGQGIGKALSIAIIALAKKKGAARIELTSNPKRDLAHQLYEKLGFEKRDTNVYRMKL